MLDAFVISGASVLFVLAALGAIVSALFAANAIVAALRADDARQACKDHDVTSEVSIFTEHRWSHWPIAGEPFRFTQETHSRCDVQGWEIRYKVLVENGEAAITHMRMRWKDDAPNTWREIPVKGQVYDV